MDSRTTTLGAAAIAVGLAFFVNGCRRQVNYTSVVSSGASRIPEASEFRNLFTNTYEFVTYHDGYYGEPLWNSKALLNGRYILTFQSKIDVNYATSTVTNYHSPKFFLTEIISAQRLASGQTSVTHGTNFDFGPAQWKKLVQSGGNFEALGVKLQTNAPVELLDSSWWSL